MVIDEQDNFSIENEYPPKLIELFNRKLCQTFGNYEIIPYLGGVIAIDRQNNQYLFRLTKSRSLHCDYNIIKPNIQIFGLNWLDIYQYLKKWIFKILHLDIPLNFVKFGIERYSHRTTTDIISKLSTKKKYPKIKDRCNYLSSKKETMVNTESKIELDNLLKEDLGVWFGTKKKPKGSKQPKGPWVNICRKDENGKHPPCGRPEADSKGYPKCRAAGVAGKMSDSEKKSACSQKRSAEKKNPKSGTGNSPTMVSHKKKNESISNLIKKVLNEIYDSEKLYVRSSLLNRLSSAPKNIRDIVKNQKGIPCTTSDGNETICVKIPEVVQVYLSGRY